MLKDGINGFCMAFGSMKEKKTALKYLVKLGAGWAVGMILAVLALSAKMNVQNAADLTTLMDKDVEQK